MPCIMDKGGRKRKFTMRNPGIGKLRKGDLTNIGYHASKTRTARHRALNKAVRKYGPLSTFRKLNAVMVYSKKSSKSKTFKKDRNWIKKKFM